ncbi:ribosomal RNA small subunit methyltransferase I [Comamonas serinivorans]|uniref:Ribosomal RNA small subunit methyltransferase I n=1 Tax=Comamonas serinivorans TaxID=1082851 RepID=A0A1Y0EL74_9BURK|nr:SAM-dependent methyltransferase [Comamonas serinivorans]ARU04062.1 ribosomal RNA small subunit methyltransferase I [Comamonas serinivorans]
MTHSTENPDTAEVSSSPSEQPSPRAPGRLVLVPAPLDFGCEAGVPITEVLPHGVLHTASQITHWVCENAKTARAVLKRIGEVCPLAVPLQQMQISELPRAAHKQGDHDGTHEAGRQTEAAARAWLAPTQQGLDVGLISEAGMPAIADPGSAVVRAAHALGVPVVVLPGPVSLLLALAASGLNGQSFAFIGYLPQDASQRSTRIKQLEAHALKTGQTQIAIETPFRNAALLQALVQGLQPNTRLSLSWGLTLPGGHTRSGSVSQWRSWLRASGANAEANAVALPSKHDPAVFAFGR